MSVKIKVNFNLKSPNIEAVGLDGFRVQDNGKSLH